MRVLLLLFLLVALPGCEPPSEPAVRIEPIPTPPSPSVVEQDESLGSILHGTIAALPGDVLRPVVSRSKTDDSRRKNLTVERLKVEFEPVEPASFDAFLARLEEQPGVWVSRLSMARAKQKADAEGTAERLEVDGFELVRYRVEDGVFLAQLSPSLDHVRATDMMDVARRTVQTAVPDGRTRSIELTTKATEAKCELSLELATMQESVAVEQAFRDEPRIEFERGQTRRERDGTVRMDVRLRVRKGN